MASVLFRLSWPQQLLRIAGRARVSIQLISASDVQVRSLQDKPLTVDAELDTRLALQSAKSSVVDERENQHRNLQCLVLSKTIEAIIKRQAIACVLDRRNARVIRQLRGREFFAGPLART